MKFFCDSSVLVAAAVEAHPDHARSLALLDRARPGSAFCAAHSLAELYATLTALPLSPRPHPTDVLEAVRRAARLFTLVSLTGKEYVAALQAAAERRATSGQVYDALILKAARKSRAQTIYTWNLRHFEKLADPPLAARLRVP